MLWRASYPFQNWFLRLFLLPLGLASGKLPTPTDEPHAHASGANPDRILLFGSGPAIGYGVLSHDLALPGQLARQLSQITGKGVDIDVVADPDVLIQDAAGSLQQLNLWKYDAIALTVGVNNALLGTSSRVWRRATGALFAFLDRELPRRTRVIVIEIPQIAHIGVFARWPGWFADRRATVLNRITKRAASGFPRITFVSHQSFFSADKSRILSPKLYLHWARTIAGPLSRELAEVDRDEAEYSLSAGEDARQRALDELNILDTEPEERFDRIVRLACQLFSVPMATISFTDHDRQWVKAAVDFPFAEFPRPKKVDIYDARNSQVFFCEDLLSVPLFAKHPFVTGPPHARFYASYSIESSFGEPVGTIALYGVTPRTWSDADTRILRDLALMVQRELVPLQRDLGVQPRVTVASAI